MPQPCRLKPTCRRQGRTPWCVLAPRRLTTGVDVCEMSETARAGHGLRPAADGEPRVQACVYQARLRRRQLADMVDALLQAHAERADLMICPVLSHKVVGSEVARVQGVWSRSYLVRTRTQSTPSCSHAHSTTFPWLARPAKRACAASHVACSCSPAARRRGGLRADAALSAAGVSRREVRPSRPAEHAAGAGGCGCRWVSCVAGSL